MSIHLDISQLLLDPRRTGIQRAERELIRHWPGPAPLRPCRIDPSTGAMHALPDEILAALCAEPAPGGTAMEAARLARYIRPGAVVQPERLLSAELFCDTVRTEYYRSHPNPAGLYWVIYDFLPWLQPDWFAPHAPTEFMPYLRALRRVPNLAFISGQTRDDYVRRIARHPHDGPVIPMGGDGLGLERQTFDPARRSFVMLGTIEPRKNPAAAMRAFQALWQAGVDAPLVMIGTAAPDAATELASLQQMSGDKRFTHLPNLDDAGVRNQLRQARAMLFPSEGEGFGIPPMEALHAGIPAIIASSLPALSDGPALGQIRLNPPTPESIAGAIRTMLDDAQAARLWQDAARMTVPGWADFARGIARWVQA